MADTASLAWQNHSRPFQARPLGANQLISALGPRIGGPVRKVAAAAGTRRVLPGWPLDAPAEWPVMLVVGLTGGIASGKSTVSSLLASKHHIPIIDADHLARVVVEPDQPAFKAIVKHFGEGVLQTLPNGKRVLDRPKLGARVFDNEADRKVLNGIVHPAVRKAMVWAVISNWLRGEKVVVVDVPLLIETKLWQWCGWVVVVYVNDACQLSRLLARPPLNPADPPLSTSAAQSRIASQLPLKSKLPYADTVLDNSGQVRELEAQVAAMVDKWTGQGVSTVARVKRDVRWLAEWLVPPLGLFLGLWAVWSTRRRVAYRLNKANRGGGQEPQPATKRSRRGEDIELTHRRTRSSSDRSARL